MNNAAIAIGGLICILLVTGVISDEETHISNKLTLPDVCSLTDYKSACEKAIADAKDKRPHELFKAVLNDTADAIESVIKNSTLFKEAESDKQTKDALDVCNIVLDRAVDDLKRSFALVGDGKHDSVEDIMGDLTTWLSAVLGHQETCIDAFAKVPSETGMKMETLLISTKELSANALTIATNIKPVLSTMSIGSSISFSRKLFSEERRQLLFNSQPNAIVATDGSGHFRTIREAIARIPNPNNQPFVIKIKAGVYNEQVNVPKGLNKVIFVGDGVGNTKITGNKSWKGSGVQTFFSATVGIEGEDFMAKDLTIENTAGSAGEQAVALRLTADRAVLCNVNMDGYQDTLFVHTYRHFFTGCKITGTIDFVFGYGQSIFQKCDLIVRKPLPYQQCMVTAQGRTDNADTGGIIFQGCNILATPELASAQPPIQSFLGRPWKPLARTVIMQSNIGGFIRPEGWAPWSGNQGLDTCFYGEYGNSGAGANLGGRVKWKGFHALTFDQAASFTPVRQYGGDDWVRNSGATYTPGMM